MPQSNFVLGYFVVPDELFMGIESYRELKTSWHIKWREVASVTAKRPV